MNIKINSFIPITNVEGPGKRFCIWVQGCSIHCKGCANSHMWNKKHGTIYKTEDIINKIKQYAEKIEGITILGGEPLEQIKPIIEISKNAKEIGLSVLVFTGYYYSEAVNIPLFQELIKYIDILVDGRYEEEKKDYSRAWIGSSNQNYYFLTDRYNKNVINEYNNKIEIHFNKKNSTITLNGMGNYKKISNILEEYII